MKLLVVLFAVVSLTQGFMHHHGQPMHKYKALYSTDGTVEIRCPKYISCEVHALMSDYGERLAMVSEYGSFNALTGDETRSLEIHGTLRSGPQYWLSGLSHADSGVVCCLCERGHFTHHETVNSDCFTIAVKRKYFSSFLFLKDVDFPRI